jgi:Tol biopolymer transport system component/C-terminal processing protease CtpA/Prc
MQKILVFIALLIGATPLLAQPLWMRYPAISPDGAQIAFCYQDDIWLVPATGGEAKPITRHEAHDFMPVWSHNGQMLAFASFRHGNYDVFLYHLATGEVSRLTYHSSNDLPCDFTLGNDAVLFGAQRMDDPDNAQFPYGRLGELYQVGTNGQSLRMVMSMSAEYARFTPDGKTILFQNKKGYEDEWRKHHTSSVARDIMSYQMSSGNFQYLTQFAGEDRNPVPNSDGSGFYYLSEESGSFNVWMSTIDGSKRKQLTEFSRHPVRFLTRAGSGMLCFSYHGEIYTLTEGASPIKVPITLHLDYKTNNAKYMDFQGEISEYAVSPNGKEVAVVIRGNIYVSSIDHGTTRAITNTPWQERSVGFSPDGRALIYAAEKGESWSIYQTKLAMESEKYFYNSTFLDETPIVETKAECFQPRYAPDGLEVAFLEERTTLRVVNLKTGKVRTVLPGHHSYSYSDGDQWYDWSPDGKWFLVDFNDPNRWMGEVGLIAASGEGQLVNLTQSGYGDGGGTWMAKGNLALYISDRFGMRSHGSWGSESDVMGVFLNKKSFELFNKPLSELELEDESKLGDAEKDKEAKEDNAVEVSIDLEGLSDRKVRLSLHSSRLAGAVVDADCRNLYYLARYEKGTDLWKYDMKKREVRNLAKFEAGAYQLWLDPSEKYAYVLSGGRVQRVELASGKLSPVSVAAAAMVDFGQERAYLFEHMWRQAAKKFYDPMLHQVDWAGYKADYASFLPHINNNHDFAEMMSELLGELNASHTGCRYFSRWKHGDETASLGCFIDYSYAGPGLKVLSVLPRSPLLEGGKSWTGGEIITAINGQLLTGVPSFHALLNHQAGVKVLIDYTDDNGKAQQQYVVPIPRWQESELLYQRWVKERNARVEALSGGKLAYVHVRGMDDASFRVVYDELLGKHSGKLGVVVDTRFNGGGWLHDDLATLLQGEAYVDFVPRGQYIGSDPHEKWNRPSCVLAGEGNYSDAHAFPWVYQTLGIGPVVGMPVPGTMTAVWWETLQDPTLVFGIPQVGARDAGGDFLENKELQPDILVNNAFGDMLNGRDAQLEAGVNYLLKQK